MSLELTDIKEKDRNLLFALFKEHMKPVIEEAFGWDEQYQETRFKTRLMPEWFHWVVSSDSRVGLVCFKTIERAVHIHLLIVFKEEQGKGLGQLVTRQLESLAHAEGKDLTLSCFKNNTPALSLYRKLNLSVVSEDEHFYDFISKFT